jgi:polyhydroxyalkanoate synthase
MPNSLEADHSIVGALFSLADVVRRAQGNALEALGFGPDECSYRLIASGPHWQLRDYVGDRQRSPILIIPAPIKRPYAWDLSRSLSVVRTCQQSHRQVYLLEWKPPEGGDAGLDVYADRAIEQSLAAISHEAGPGLPFLVGHSLGGTLAATFAALEPRRMRGLVLLGAPLCFRPGSSSFRDAIVALASSVLPEAGVVSGTALSQLSAMAAPATFIWSRLADSALALGHARASDIQVRIERWALDEVALPGRLVREIMQWFYQEDRLCRGTLRLRGRTISPREVRAPTLAIINAADAIAPSEAVMPYLEAVSTSDVRLLEIPGEPRVGLQHLAVLVGPRSHPIVWQQVVEWLDAHEEAVVHRRGRRHHSMPAAFSAAA